MDGAGRKLNSADGDLGVRTVYRDNRCELAVGLSLNRRGVGAEKGQRRFVDRVEDAGRDFQ